MSDFQLIKSIFIYLNHSQSDPGPNLTLIALIFENETIWEHYCTLGSFMLKHLTTANQK